MKLPTRLSACVMTTAMILGSAGLHSAIAQGTSPPPAALSAGPSGSPTLRGPSFQTAGLKLTVVGAASGASGVTLSLILENVGKNDYLVAVIGPVNGIVGGTTLYSPNNGVSGIADCQSNLDPRPTQIDVCLTRDKAALPIQQFTLIEHGNTIPFTVTLSSNGKIERSQSLGLSMTAAIMPDDSNSDASATEPPSRAAKPTPGALPARMRFISLGIPTVPLGGDGPT